MVMVVMEYVRHELESANLELRKAGSRLKKMAECDPLTGARFLSDLYRATDPAYPGPCTVPLIWDLRTRRIVSNDVAQITVMLETEFRPFHRPGTAAVRRI